MINIYIVEDFEFNIRLYKAIFHDAPEFKLFFAQDGLEGLEMIKNGNPDIIILDYKIPMMYGTEICKELRKIDKFKEIPIIAVSSSPIDGLVEREEFFKLAGFTKLFAKPLKKTEFLGYIREVLD